MILTFLFYLVLFIAFSIDHRANSILLVPNEYESLREIYYSTNGPYWTYDPRVELNFDPWDFSSSNAKNNPCNHLWYGTLCIGYETYNGMGKLMILNMTGIGNMTGQLPPVISNFTKLMFFVVTDNPKITGDVPTFGLMPDLQVLNLSSNALSGTIPDCWYDFQSLSFLSLANNQLRGSIPNSIYFMESMMYLSFFNNTLTGTVSHMLANMVNLLSFNIGYNRAGGRLPTFIRTMQFLEQFLVENNRFTGPLPLQFPSALLAVQLSNNYFTSSLPATLCAASNLTLFAAANNRLTGTLPHCFGFFPDLAVLQLQSNLMNGPIQGIFDPYTSTNLWVVDITDNSFSGSFPSELLHLPSLMSLAASKNCFTGSLSQDVCNATESLHILALDGLQSGSRCALRPWDPLNLLRGYVTNLMRGSLPSCMWTIPNIQVLHLAGNGFSGTLPDDISLPPSLTSVSVTHNELYGTVPAHFFGHPFLTLDLSFNNFEGDISGLSNMPFAYNASAAGDGASLSLQVNRFSGRLPKSLWHAWNVNVLNGNLFNCAQNRHDIPHHDPEADDYFCGSTVFDNAAALFGLVFLLCVLPTLLLIFGPGKLRCLILAPTEAMMRWLRPPHRSQKPTNERSKTSWEEPIWMHKARVSCMFTLRYVLRVQVWVEKTPEEMVDTQVKPGLDDEVEEEEDAMLDEEEALAKRWSREQQMRRFGNFYRYVAALTLLRRICFAVAIVAIVICLPIYLIFYQVGGRSSSRDGESQFSSVQERYSWITTSAFLAGPTPAETLFALWLVLLLAICYGIVRHYNVYLRLDLLSQSQQQRRKRRRKQRLLMKRFSSAVVKATDNIRDSAALLARESFSLFSSPVAVHSPLPVHTTQSHAPVVYNALQTSDLESPDVALLDDATDSSNMGVNDTSPAVLEQAQEVPLSDRNSAGSSHGSVSRGSGSRGSGSLGRGSLLSGNSNNSNNSNTRKSSVTIASDRSSDPAIVTINKPPARFTFSSASPQKMRNSSVSTAPQRLDETALAQEVTIAEMKHFFLLTSAFLGIFLLNLLISIAINAAYLVLQNTSRLTTDVKTVLQLAMAAFKLVWNMVAVRILVSKLPYSRRSAQLHVILLLTNTVLAPCMAVAFTDSSCFSDFFFGANQVCTSYELALCVETSQMYCKDSDTYYTACSRYQEHEFVTEFAPSFIYYYGCSARLLTSYIPVYLYSYTILLIAVPLGYTLLATLQRKHLPSWLMSLLDGVLRPQDRDTLRFRFLMRPTATQAMLTQHLVVLVTFGVNAPLLALVMALAIAADTFAWQLLLARYLHFGDDETPFSPTFLRPAACDTLRNVMAQKSLSKDDFPDDAISSLKQQQQQMMMVTLDATRDSTTVAENFVSARSSLLLLQNRPSMLNHSNSNNRQSLLEALSFSQTQVSESSATIPEETISETDEEEAAFMKQLAQEKEQLLHREQQLEARLNELNTVIGRAWRGMRNTMWLVFYCGLCFNAGMLLDVCGYVTGWTGALWLPLTTLCVLVLCRLCFLEGVYMAHAFLRRTQRWLVQRHKQQQKQQLSHSTQQLSWTQTLCDTLVRLFCFCCDTGSQHSNRHNRRHKRHRTKKSVPLGDETQQDTVEQEGVVNEVEDEEVEVEQQRVSGLDELLARSFCCIRLCRDSCCWDGGLQSRGHTRSHQFYEVNKTEDTEEKNQRLLSADSLSFEINNRYRVFSSDSRHSRHSSSAAKRSYSHTLFDLAVRDSDSTMFDSDDSDEEGEYDYDYNSDQNDEEAEEERDLRRRDKLEARRDGFLST